jgi:hypothetical protein
LYRYGVALTVQLRVTCAEEASRVGIHGLVHAFNRSAHVGVAGQEASSSSNRGGGDNDDDDDDDDDGAAAAAAADAAESAAAFASMICVKGELAKGKMTSKSFSGAVKKIAQRAPCKLAQTKTKARQLVAAAAASDEDQTALATNDALATKFTDECTRNNGAMLKKTLIAASACALEDPLMGLETNEISTVRRCQNLARTALARGESVGRVGYRFSQPYFAVKNVGSTISTACV